MKKSLSIYWARRDFRLSDNPALTASLKYSKDSGSEFLPLFILEEYMCANDPKYQFGYPSRIFLSKAIPLFSKNFHNFLLLRGTACKTFQNLSNKFNITIFVNEDVHEDFYKQIKKIKSYNIKIKLYSDMLTVSKEVVSGTGKKYSVFTPFKNAVWHDFVSMKPLKKVDLSDIKYIDETDIKSISNSVKINEDVIIENLGNRKLFLADSIIYDIDELINEKMKFELWYYSEKEAIDHFNKFIKNGLSDYRQKRDYLEMEGTSHMSIALAWGLVSARTLTNVIISNSNTDLSYFDKESSAQGPMHYISELIWREFYKYLYYHNPKLMDEEFQEKFRNKIIWVDKNLAHDRFVSWIKGQTGYPIVDAAMNQLAQTGYMHNRARMIVSSILTKNLGVDWRWGQEYFRAMLIDLDESSNNGGWQWGASVGADPKPIRIFNPYLQAENYDSKNFYQEKYLSKNYLSDPPKPIVEHKNARQDALSRYRLDESKDGLARDY